MKELYSRRSVRKYTNKEISNELIEELLRAGMNAPSARNMKPYEFIIIKDKETLKELSEIKIYGKMLNEANTAIAVVSNPESYFGMFDVGACVQNILLSATNKGIGTCIVGLREEGDEEEKAKKILSIPNELRIYCVIAMGYPNETKKDNNNFYPEKIYYEGYKKS